MHEVILEFARRHAARFGGRVIDVGSYNVNGSLRSALPITLGVDMLEGPDVDRVVNVDDLLRTFGEASFDGVASADALEHMEHWQVALENMWGILKPGGPFLLTLANPDKGFHGYPHDYWRWPLERFRRLFGGNAIVGDFYAYPSMGVCAIKTVDLDLSHLPDRVVSPPPTGPVRALSTSLESAWVDRLVALAGLERGQRVLEIVSPIGSLAAAIAQRFGHDHAYQGVESRSAVGGSWRLPATDGSVDLVVALSGIAHALESDLSQLIEESARVLAPGGRLVSTGFALPPDYDPATAAPASRFRLVHRYSSHARVLYAENPTKVIGYDAEFLERLFRAKGYSSVAIHVGSWNGRAGAASSHDILVGTRTGSSPAA